MKFRVVATSNMLTDAHEKELGWRVFCGASAIEKMLAGECLDSYDNTEVYHLIKLPTDDNYNILPSLWEMHADIFVVEIDTETGAYEILHS